jgi:hypothetical protein
LRGLVLDNFEKKNWASESELHCESVISSAFTSVVMLAVKVGQNMNQ